MNTTPRKRSIDLSQKTDVKDTDVFLLSSHSGDYNSTVSNMLTLFEKNIHTYIHNQDIGEIKSFAINDIPEGYLKMDGSQHTIADYPLLWDKINGVLDGVVDHKDGSFNLPNWTDYFLRYAPARKVGNTQPWAIENIKGKWHIRSFNKGGSLIGESKGVYLHTKGGNKGLASVSGFSSLYNEDIINFDASRVVKASNETRPMNVSVIYAIKCDLK